MELRRGQVLAWRAYGHGLASRRSAVTSTTAAMVGIRRTSRAPESYAARVDQATARTVERALDAKELVAVFGPRGNATIVPVSDVGAFTAGVLPKDDGSLRAALPRPFHGILDAAGITATDALATVVDAIQTGLAAGPLPWSDLAGVVTRAVPEPLAPPCRGRCPDPHVEDDLFRLAGVTGVMCYRGAGDHLDLTDRWLAGVEHSVIDREDLRAELVRRYLRCYGPSKPAAFAAWAGISPADARQRLDALSDEVVRADVDGTKAGVMAIPDAERAAALDPPTGVRFLPPYDPYLLDRDRSTLLPDRESQRRVWRPVGNPGLLLVDGRPAATWRTRSHRDRIDVPIEPLLPGLTVDPELLHAEAQHIATAHDQSKPVVPLLA